MLQNVDIYTFMYRQLKSFSLIIFIITFFLIITKNKYNIIPLNIITLVGSIILFHFYPNYYKIVKSKDPRLIPLLAVFDFIVHYTPLIYIIAYKVFNKTKINYTLCAIIFILYFVLFHSDIQKTYLDYNDYFTKAIT
jgi:hypothetical protein